MADDSRAPGELELVREFVNTLDVEDDVDVFATPAGLAGWLGDHGLDPGGRIGARDLERAVTAREGLRALLLANNGEPLDPATAQRLNEAASASRLAVRFGAEGESQLEPAGAGVDRALGAIYGIVFRSMAEGTWERLKACRADACQWGFYDNSKNRSGTWCSMKVCGNREKARSFRERNRKS